MIYTVDITTDANTPASSPLHSVLKVTGGLVYRVEVEFPPGPQGLCHVVICDGSYQVWPSTPGVSFHSDNYVIGFDDTYLKTVQPFQFNLYTWNLDETWEHSLQVRIGLVDQEIYMARFLPTYTYKYFKEMIEELTQKQEEIKAAVLTEGFSWLTSTGEVEE